MKLDKLLLFKGGSERGLDRGSDYLRRETDALREDLRELRDKNHQLVQDNIKLTEHLKDLDARGGRGSTYKGMFMLAALV